MEYKRPKDKNGKEYQKGDLFIEYHAGDVIWDGTSKIRKPPIGYFSDEKVFDGGWMACTFKPGVTIYEGRRIPLYINTYDGEYIGKWEKTMVVGHLDDIGEELF